MSLEAAGDGGRARRREFGLALAIVAAAFLVYLPAICGGFFWDDDRFLYANKMITAAGRLHEFWFSAKPADYFPLTSSVLWVEWRIWGIHPAGYHVVNVLLHAISAVLVWRVLKRLAVPGAWLAGLLFAVHPVAAASAAWITELKNTLPMALTLLALLAYLSFDEGGKKRWYFAAAALFLLALLAKTSVVMLPAALLLCAWWRRGKISLRDLARSVPFFALALALACVTIWFQYHKAIGAEVVRPEGIASRVAAAGWIAWFYLYKALLPAGLCVIYPRWSVSGSSALAFLPLALLIAGLALLWMRRRSWGRAPLFAAAWFLLFLLPVLGFVDMALMEHSLVADHLQYVAMIAVIAFAAGALAKFTASGGARAVLGCSAIVVCVATLSSLTFVRARLYGHDVDLWRDNVEKNPAAYLAWNNLGWACSRDQRFDEAAESFERAVQLKSDYALAWNGLGAIRSMQGQTDEALRDLNEAIRLAPKYPSPYGNRAVTCWKLKEYDKAWADVKKFEELGGKPDPRFVEELTAASGRKP